MASRGQSQIWMLDFTCTTPSARSFTPVRSGQEEDQLELEQEGNTLPDIYCYTVMLQYYQFMIKISYYFVVVQQQHYM